MFTVCNKQTISGLFLIVFGLLLQASWKGYKQRKAYKNKLKTFQDSVDTVIKVTVLSLFYYTETYLFADSALCLKHCCFCNLVTVAGKNVES